MSLLRRLTAWLGRRALIATAIAIAVTTAIWFGTTRFELPTGFSARYYNGSEWAGEPVLVTVDERVTTAVVSQKWARTDQPFSVRWEGYLRVDREGTYRLSVLSDDGTRLYVDNRLTIDNGGIHGFRQATLPVPLDRGVHAIRLDYFQADADYGVQLYWSARPSGPLTPLTGLAISPMWRSRPDFQRGRAIEIVRLVVIAIWTLAYWWLLLRFVIVPACRRFLGHHAPGGVPASVIGLLAVAALLYATAMTWGLPGPGWGPDELAPSAILEALGQRFTNGWWSKYGPVHFYLLSIAGAPLHVWQWLDPTAFNANYGIDILYLLYRTIAVVMAVFTVFNVYLCGAYLFRQWPATVTAAIAAFTMPMVYYAKTVNVDMPYVFWFSIALVSLARIAADDSKADYVLFAFAGMLAVCTKDQAYGLFGVPALALAVRSYLRAQGTSAGEKLMVTLGARHIWLAIAAGLGTFAVVHNLLFNWRGFASHLSFIQNEGSVQFRMFPMTVAGIWQLWQATWMLIRISIGWPVFVVMLAGIALSLRPFQRRLWWMVLPAVSYFATFLAVTGFTYDRFLLPVLLVLAFFAGLVVQRVEDVAPSATVGVRAGVVAVLVYTVAYVAVVNAAMLRDSRYDVESWLRANVEPGSRIGLMGGGPEHVPRIDDFVSQFLRPTRDDLESASFDYLVVNLDWMQRWGPERVEHDLLVKLQDDQFAYRKMFEARSAVSFAGMAFDPRFATFGSTGYSTLTKINPPLVVFKRMPSR